MNKEAYTHMRQHGQISQELLFEYYLQQCKEMNVIPLVKDINIFASLFQQFFMMFSPDLEPILKDYDSKFELNILKDKEGNTIKIY
jgi:hypothetical protein